jgi:hypothetical protein
MPDMEKGSPLSWPGLRRYSREGDELSFAGAPLGSIEYWTFRDRFFHVELNPAPGQAVKLYEAFVAAFGQPQGKDELAGMDEWALKDSEGNTIEISCCPKADEFRIVFQPIGDELMEDVANP